MAKLNKKGRNKYQPFIRLHRGVTESAAWKSLSCEARALLLEIWARHNGANNGQIGYSHREARKALRIGNDKVQRAFRDLEERGFLRAVVRGHFNCKVESGAGRATEWELTAEPCNGQPPSGTYRNWPGNLKTAPIREPLVPTLGTARALK